MASPRGAAEQHRGPGQLSGGAGGVRRCDCLRQVGGEAAADGSGMGIRGAGRADGQIVRVGRSAAAGWKMDGEYLAGYVSGSRYRGRRLCGPCARWRNFPRTATGSTTWQGTSGSGAPIGIARTIMASWRPRAAWRKIRPGRMCRWIPPIRERRSVWSAADRSCARPVIARGTGRNAQQGRAVERGEPRWVPLRAVRVRRFKNERRPYRLPRSVAEPGGRTRCH